jgi:hypothetical protein
MILFNNWLRKETIEEEYGNNEILCKDEIGEYGWWSRKTKINYFACGFPKYNFLAINEVMNESDTYSKYVEISEFRDAFNKINCAINIMKDFKNVNEINLYIYFSLCDQLNELKQMHLWCYHKNLIFAIRCEMKEQKTYKEIILKDILKSKNIVIDIQKYFYEIEEWMNNSKENQSKVELKGNILLHRSFGLR